MLFARNNPLEKIYAEIIGESSDNTHNIRFINRGSSQRVKRNYIVIRKEGLVGRILPSELELVEKISHSAGHLAVLVETIDLLNR